MYFFVIAPCLGFGVISSMPVEDGFRNVDRALFVPPVSSLYSLSVYTRKPHFYSNQANTL